MEAFTQKWAIISLLEPMREGSEFYYTDFPLHLTLAGVFAADKPGRQLADELAALLHGQPPVQIVSDKKDMFGPEKNIAVMRIQQSADLLAVYKRIHIWLQQAGARYNSPQYEGSGYVAHSTFQKSGSLTAGEKRTLQSVSLIDLFPGNNGYQRKIFRTIPLT